MNITISSSSFAPLLSLVVALVGQIPDAPTGSTTFEIEDTCLRASGGEWKAAWDMANPKLAAQRAKFDEVRAQIDKIVADKKTAEEDAIRNPPPPTAEQLEVIADAKEGDDLAPILPKVADGSADPKERDRVLAWLLKAELRRRKGP